MKVQRNPAHDAPVYVGMAEAAERLGVCTRSIRRWIAAGHLPAKRLPGRGVIRIDVSDLERLLTDIPTTKRDAS